MLKILGIKMGLFEGKGPENEIILILSIIGFTGISGENFSQGLPMLVLLKNIGFHFKSGYFIWEEANYSLLPINFGYSSNLILYFILAY